MLKIFRRKKYKAPTPPPTYREFLELFDLCSPELQKEYTEIIMQLPRPDYLGHHQVPENLNHLTYGQLDDLRDLKDGDELPFELVKIIYGSMFDLFEVDVNEVFGFINFCTSEVQRINKLFASIKHEYTKEEKAAGIDKLDFGTFGVLDWYAKRMGITDHNEVRDIAWVRIYQCMKNDNEQQLFERRLQDQYFKSTKTGKGR